MITHVATEAEALVAARVFDEPAHLYWNDAEGYIVFATPEGCVRQAGGRDGDGFCYRHQSFDCRVSSTEE